MPALTKYDVLEELGHGGMATVYRAHDARLGRDVAVKVLHPHLRENGEIAHRFAVEAKAVAKLRHPNIVEVYDVSSEDDAEQFLVVELIRGQTLRKILAGAGSSTGAEPGGALPPEVAAAIGVELLSALAHAHASGVVHRDVKPENVLMEHRSPASVPPPRSSDSSDESQASSRPSGGRGERVLVKLTDFGIAKLLDAQGVTSTGQVLGSPAHMAPEQIEGGDVDGRADVFGMGVLLYECMVGHLPFEGKNPAQVLRRVLDGTYPSAERERPVVGKVWSQILDRALARKPEDRFSDAQAMREAMAAELARLGVTAPRAELEAYFDDPEGFSAARTPRLIERLCDLGREARKRGDAVAAAADYNRALAYAPNDPQLLRIVSTMHRAEARMRLARRLGPLLAGTLALGTGAYFAARAVKGGPEPVVVDETDRAHAPGAPGTAPATRASTSPSEIVTAGTTPPPSSRATSEPKAPGDDKPRAVVAMGHIAPVPKVRTITLGRVRPAFGVHMAIDGVRPKEAEAQAMKTNGLAGFAFELDDARHTLTFSCEPDVCQHRTIEVPAGAEGARYTIELGILPAKLVVEGDPNHAYTLEENPTISLLSGVAAEIPMTKGSSQTFTVIDKLDPNQRKSVTLQAGKRAVVSFGAR